MQSCPANNVTVKAISMNRPNRTCQMWLIHLSNCFMEAIFFPFFCSSPQHLPLHSKDSLHVCMALGIGSGTILFQDELSGLNLFYPVLCAREGEAREGRAGDPFGVGVVFSVTSTLVMPNSEKRDGVPHIQHLQPPLPMH